jgi:hypothetical protein
VSVTHLDLSLPLQRAAQAEHRRIDAALVRIDERLGALETERAKLRDEKARLKQRQQLLDQIIDPTHGGTLKESPGVVLRGAKLRVEATRLLMHHVGPRRAIHYRDWYQIFLEAGFVVLGKRPEATFLTAVSRSPVVRRADEPGTYYIDPVLAEHLARELHESRAELADLETVLAGDLNPKPALRQHRVKLLASSRHLASRLSEAESALDVATATNAYGARPLAS